MKLLKYENSKLKQQFIFTLPATKAVCGRICPGCYAAKPQVRFPKTVLPYREAMLAASQQPDFAQRIISELSSTRRSARVVRLHESGEFYSQAYVDQWLTIAQALPNFTFYAFTKRLAHFDFSQLSALPNFILINSLHFGGLNYGPTSSAPTNAFICPSSQGAICGTTCTYCQTKSAQSNSVYFPIH